MSERAPACVRACVCVCVCLCVHARACGHACVFASVCMQHHECLGLLQNIRNLTCGLVNQAFTKYSMFGPHDIAYMLLTLILNASGSAFRIIMYYQCNPRNNQIYIISTIRHQILFAL